MRPRNEATGRWGAAGGAAIVLSVMLGAGCQTDQTELGRLREENRQLREALANASAGKPTLMPVREFTVGLAAAEPARGPAGDRRRGLRDVAGGRGRPARGAGRRMAARPGRVRRVAGVDPHDELPARLAPAAGPRGHRGAAEGARRQPGGGAPRAQRPGAGAGGAGRGSLTTTVVKHVGSAEGRGTCTPPQCATGQ